MTSHLIVIALLVGLVKTETDSSDTPGLDLPEQKDGRDGSGSGSFTGVPTILDYTKDVVLQITNGSQKVTLTCSARGSDLIGGHWKRVNGNLLEEKYNISLIDLDLAHTSMQLNITIVGARPVHSGLYQCVVYNKWGIALSIPTQVNITVAPPMIVTLSMNITADVLQNATFSFKAVGFNVTYQWRRSNSDDIIGTQSNLTIPEVTPSDESYYYCIAFNKGGHVISNLVTLTVKRVIALHPQNASIASGGNVTFSIIATEQSYTYHWKKKNGLLPSNAVGQNTPHLSIISATLADSGIYHCIVGFPSGYKVPSTRARLTVHETPAILSHKVVHGSGEVILICTVKGDHLNGGYWERVDRRPLSKENNNSIIYHDNGNTVLKLNITRAHPDHSGRYRCVAYNDWGIATSNIVQVTIAMKDAIVIVKQPQNITAATGSNVTISVTVKGNKFVYDWKKVHHESLPSNVAGQNSTHLNMTSVTHRNSGRYHCIITDHWGHTKRSHKSTLTVLALPVITTHPNNNGPITVAEGSDVVLRCEATGEGTLNYQWRRLSRSLPDNVQGNNTTNLTITTITVSDGGEYYCVVDNGGTGVPSIKVQVTAKVEPFIKNCSQNQELTIVSSSEKITLLWEFGGDDVNGITCQKENNGLQVTIIRVSSVPTNHTFELSLNNVRPSDSGEYSCTVSSHWGVAQSRKIKVNITVAPPRITIQPTSKAISVLEDVTLTCKAEGFEVKYKWRHNGTTHSANISQSSLTITQVVPSDAGHYVCIASTEGGKDISQSAMLMVNGLQLTPSNVTVGEGSNVQFTCSTDSPEVSWHIEKQGVAYTTVNSSLMDLHNVSEADSGYYQCSVNIRGEEIPSNQAAIAVFGLVEQLNDAIAPVGSDVVLRCSASVSTAVNCTWKHNNTAMKRNHLSLKLHNVSLTDEGSYTCEMMGNAGKAVKSTAKLEVLYVNIDPQNHTVIVGSSANFTCSPSVSSSTLTYQWLHNGTRMEHESEEVLTITNVKIGDGGTYQCVVIVNINTSVRSDRVRLNIIHTKFNISSSNHTSTNQNTVLFLLGGAGVFVAITGILFAVCCVCWCWCCRRSKKTQSMPAPEEVDSPHAVELSTVVNADRPEGIISTGRVFMTEERSSTTSNDEKVTYEISIRSDTSIMKVLDSMQPDLLELIIMSQLLPYLVKYGLLTADEKQMLQLETTTDYRKAEYFLSLILCRKGPKGEKNFVKALYELSKKPGNPGYIDIINRLHQEGITVSETSDDSAHVPAANFGDDNQSVTSSIVDASAT